MTGCLADPLRLEPKPEVILQGCEDGTGSRNGRRRIPRGGFPAGDRAGIIIQFEIVFPFHACLIQHGTLHEHRERLGQRGHGSTKSGQCTATDLNGTPTNLFGGFELQPDPGDGQSP